MSISRRSFVKSMAAGLAASGLAAEKLVANAQSNGASEALFVDRPGQPEAAPEGFDRLPLSWYKATAQRLRNRVASDGVDIAILQTDHNIVYLSLIHI